MRMQPVIDRLLTAFGWRSRAVKRFVDDTKELPLHRLAERERNIRGSLYMAPEPNYSVLYRYAKQKPSLLWFDLFSGDGYRRERVLHETNEAAPSAFLLAILFRRLNDWVPQVRLAAQEAVGRVVMKTPPDIVLNALWATLPNVRTWTRQRDIGEILLKAIDDRLDVQIAIIDAAISASSGPAASVLRQCSRNPAFDKHWSHLAAFAIQPAVRALAYRLMLKQEAQWIVGQHWEWIDKSMGERRRAWMRKKRRIQGNFDFQETLAAAAADRSPMVRRVAGDTLIERLGELGVFGQNIAQTLTKDPYPSIAERAQFALRNAAP